MQKWPDLRQILAGVPWAVAGGVATRAYMPERATQGLDILIHHRDAPDALARLTAAGYRRVADLAFPGVLLHAPDGVEVDVIFGEAPWLDEALACLNSDPAGYPVLGLPYLVLMKLAASRGRDVGDLTTMLGLASDEALAAVRAAVSRYASDAHEDLESLIYLGQLELRQI